MSAGNIDDDLAEIDIPADDIDVRIREETDQLLIELAEFRVEILDLAALLIPAHANDGMSAPIGHEAGNICDIRGYQRAFNRFFLKVVAEDSTAAAGRLNAAFAHGF